MKIRAQFIITMLLFGALLLVSSVLLITTEEQVNAVNRQRAIAASIQAQARDLSYLSNDYLLHRESQQRARWESAFASLSNYLAQLETHVPEQVTLVGNIKANQQRLQAVFYDVVSALAQASPGSPVELSFIQTSWSRMEVQSQGIVFDATRLEQTFDEEGQQLQARNMILVMALVGIFAAFFILNYLLVFRRTLKSLSVLQTGTIIVGGGNLDYAIAVKHNDEVGELSRAFNQMTTSLKDVTASKAELEREIAERQKAEEKAKRQKAIEEGINRILREALTCETDEELGRVCLTVAEELTQSKFGFVDELNPQGQLDAIAISDPGWDVCRMSKPAGHGELPTSLKIHGIYGRVILDGKGFFTNDPSSHPDSIGVPQGHPPLTAFLGVPLTRDNKTMGMVGLGNREGGYRTEDLEAMEALAPAIVESLIAKRGEEALRTSVERYRSFVEVTGQVGWTTNADGEVVEDIPSFRQFTGQSYEEVKGWGWSKALHPDDVERTMRIWTSAVEQKTNYEIEYRLRRHDGVYRYFLARGVPVFADDGNIREWVGTCIDIMERKRMEERLAAQDRLAYLGRMSGTIAHEVKNPLAAVDASAYFLEKTLKDAAAKTREHLDRIRMGVARASNIIEKLLEMSRMKEPKLTPVDLSRFVDEVVKGNSIPHTIGVVLKTSQEEVTIMADREQLQMAVSNLLRNAVEAMGQEGTLTVCVGKAGNQAELSIADTGPGIAQEHMARVFQPLFTTKQGGVGFGLALAKTVAEKHGGKIELKSEPGKGATFTICLPLNGQREG